MKTLNTVQGFHKAGRIISKVVFILCIVGAALCVAGIVSLALMPEGFKIGDVTFAAFVKKEAGVSVNTCYAYLAMGIAFCAGEAVLSKFAELYFKRELKAGTPFTFEGAKELIRLGILSLVIPAAAAAVAAIAHAVISSVLGDVAENNWNDAFSFGMGFMFIFTGFICRHGAELNAERSAEQKTAE